MSPRFKYLFFYFFLPLFLYFSMYTWNWKTGYLDRLAAATGLEVTGWILTPGRWLQSNVNELWSRYVYLVGVRQENEDLVLRVRELEQQVSLFSEKAKAADRLNSLLRFNPETPWEKRGARVIGQKLGPGAVLETMLIDAGSVHGVRPNDAVISPRGVVGRVVKPGLHFSSVLLLTDPSSRIPVLTSEGRVPAIVRGQGAGSFLEVRFIPRNDPVSPGEILLSSGQGGIFPKGIPVARVVEVTPAEASLFQKVYAEPLLALRYYEELLVLSRTDGYDAGAPVMAGPEAHVTEANATFVNATSPVGAGPGVPPVGTRSSNATRQPVKKKS